MTYPPPWIHNSAGPASDPPVGRNSRTPTPDHRVSASMSRGTRRHIARVAIRIMGNVTGLMRCLGASRAARRSSG